jgi:hypothetical protein
MGSGKSLAAYREEAAKCMLVCANCHGEIEAGLLRSPSPGAVHTRAAELPEWRRRVLLGNSQATGSRLAAPQA